MTWWQAVAVVTPLVALVGFAVYRFAKVEAAVAHQGKCQRVVVKQLARLRVAVNRIERKVGA